MSRIATFALPDVGEGLTEAEIVTWHVAVGELVSVNQVFVEIETAKAVVELPSPLAGRVAKLLVEPGATIAVGTPIIAVDTDPDAGPLDADPVLDRGSTALAESGSKIGETLADGRIATLVGFVAAASQAGRRARRRTPSEPGAVAERLERAAVAEPPERPAPPLRAPLASPPVRKLARDLGVDLSTVSAARADGVISRLEVQAAAQSGGPSPAATPDPHSRQTRIPVRGVRKITAQAMVSSAFTAPHVTEFLTLDVTPMMELREALKRTPQFTDVKLTPLAFAAHAVCLAARNSPEINSTWDDVAGDIVVKHYVHLGIAAATPRGLVVPNIRDADSLDLLGLATAINDLTETARAGRTSPSAMTGGTFTITNVGVFGIDTGTPIINPGESAILALGSIKDAPWVVNGNVAVRKVCQLALSFDHRVLDGAVGSRFLAEMGALFAQPGLALGY